MPREPRRLRLRRLLPVLVVATFIGVTVFGGTMSARPLATANPISAAAFAPVVIPGGRPGPQLTPTRSRSTDVDPLPVAGERVEAPSAGPTPAAAPKATREPTKARTPTVHVWPLPVRGLLTTRYSEAHPGIDLAAPAGTPVRAIAAGTVVWSGWKDTGGGYVVVIRHSDGMISTYNHNRRLLVRAGDAVRAGQQIAEVGSTGWSTGPHLDLRISMGGRLVNPLRLEWRR